MVVPSGAVLAFDATLLIDRRITLRGTGELRWTAGIEQAPALRVTAEGVAVREVVLSNPDHLGSASGKRNIGVDIAASEVTVDGVRIVGFQNGVINEPSGEFEGTIVTNCRIVDVVGAGGGRGSTSRHGEDRGDGITIWGARAVVADNVVSALSGTDARIGIHAESLATYANDPGEYLDSMFAITGNVVTGPFRRGIVLEAAMHGTVSGNTISDNTWWGIAAIDTRSVTISDNTIRWTRAEEDDQGKAWGPSRGPIVVYRSASSTVVDGNVIEIRGVASAAIRLQDAVMPEDESETFVGSVDTVVSANIVQIAGGSCPSGLVLQRALRPVVVGNRFTVSAPWDARGGIVSYLSANLLIADNSLLGPGEESGYGVRHEGEGTVHVTGNRVEGFRVALAVTNSSAGVTIAGNTVQACATGIDTFGSSGPSVIASNRLQVSGTRHINAQPATSYVTTRHMGTARPAGGVSGDLLVGNGLLWVNDQGTWRSVKVT
ncbi:right-handed parallel beta-helix repeat-containing protein [Plantibacter sp. lyk4-40-MEA-4]|uniref:right-handed parallel beta-helix repeat-containing protein n=1 Tax=Plantibacter sp. lyk4-40-MEA-4 TaxID=3040298 RepID=UPI002549FAC3|nr:right-handed parallel beta-helix repeat-containing protein [Plantibacter sp. lyk4-40-MEA-4]